MLLHIHEILGSHNTMTERQRSFLEGESNMWLSALLNLLISAIDIHTVK